MDDEAAILDLGDGVALDMPAGAQNGTQKLQRLIAGNAKPSQKRRGRPPIVRQITSAETTAIPDGESQERRMIRLLLACARARTQLAAIIPDQCTGCVDRHKMAFRMRAIDCHCVCHEARGYLAKTK